MVDVVVIPSELIRRNTGTCIIQLVLATVLEGSLLFLAFTTTVSPGLLPRTGPLNETSPLASVTVMAWNFTLPKLASEKLA